MTKRKQDWRSPSRQPSVSSARAHFKQDSGARRKALKNHPVQPHFTEEKQAQRGDVSPKCGPRGRGWPRIRVPPGLLMQFSFQHTMLPPRKAQSSTFHPKRFLTSELGNRPVPPPRPGSSGFGQHVCHVLPPCSEALGLGPDAQAKGHNQRCVFWCFQESRSEGIRCCQVSSSEFHL